MTFPVHGKTTACGGRDRGYDAGKQIKGRKRFILGDPQGLVLRAGETNDFRVLLGR